MFSQNVDLLHIQPSRSAAPFLRLKKCCRSVSTFNLQGLLLLSCWRWSVGPILLLMSTTPCTDFQCAASPQCRFFHSEKTRRRRRRYKNAVPINCCWSLTCFKSEDEEELVLSSSSYTWAFVLISDFSSLSLPCTFFFCSAQNRSYLGNDDEEEKQTAREEEEKEEEEKREKMHQRCCCYQCKQDPYYSLWMRCSSVSRLFHGTRQTRLNLHHLHSLLQQTLGRRRSNTRVLIGERERERERNSMYVCTYQSRDVFCRS